MEENIFTAVIRKSGDILMIKVPKENIDNGTFRYGDYVKVILLKQAVDEEVKE